MMKIRKARIRSPTSHDIDVYVGSRIKQKRILNGLSQTQLGTQCNLTYQQIQKYEMGLHRVSVSRLCELAKALQVSVLYFFQDMPPEFDGTEKIARNPATIKRGDFSSNRETLILIRAYYNIPTIRMRRAILDLIISSWRDPDLYSHVK